jgi:hypothetical protein
MVTFSRVFSKRAAQCLRELRGRERRKPRGSDRVLGCRGAGKVTGVVEMPKMPIELELSMVRKMTEKEKSLGDR